MYQSVFVIAEEKNECIIATEVSFSPYEFIRFVCMTFIIK